MRPYAVAAMVVGSLAAVQPAAAQRFAVELKAGASVGNYTETGAGLDLLPAPSFGAVFEMRLTESLVGYAGFTRSTFGCEEGFCVGRDVSLTSQGLVAGVRWSTSLPARPWIRAGVAGQALQVTADAQDETSDLGIGWDLGAGIEFPVGRRFRIRPGATYLRHGAATDQGDGHVAVLVGELGIRVGLGR